MVLRMVFIPATVNRVEVINPLQPQSSDPYCPPKWVARTSAGICIYSTLVEKTAEARINQKGKMNIISAC